MAVMPAVSSLPYSTTYLCRIRYFVQDKIRDCCGPIQVACCSVICLCSFHCICKLSCIRDAQRICSEPWLRTLDCCFNSSQVLQCLILFYHWTNATYPMQQFEPNLCRSLQNTCWPLIKLVPGSFFGDRTCVCSSCCNNTAKLTYKPELATCYK